MVLSSFTLTFPVFQEFSGQQITAKFGALVVKDIGGIDPFIM